MYTNVMYINVMYINITYSHQSQARFFVSSRSILSVFVGGMKTVTACQQGARSLIPDAIDEFAPLRKKCLLKKLVYYRVPLHPRPKTN